MRALMLLNIVCILCEEPQLFGILSKHLTKFLAKLRTRKCPTIFPPIHRPCITPEHLREFCLRPAAQFAFTYPLRLRFCLFCVAHSDVPSSCLVFTLISFLRIALYSSQNARSIIQYPVIPGKHFSTFA